MILLYHGITLDARQDSPSYMLARYAFEAQMSWLSRTCRVLTLSEYMDHVRAGEHLPRRTVAVTIDDGFIGTYETMYPVLRRLGIPAAVFVSTCQPESGEVLWFAYLDALCLESDYPAVETGNGFLPLVSLSDKRTARRLLRDAAMGSGDPRSFCLRLAERYPLPEVVLRRYAGMTAAQSGELAGSGIFEVGSHTVTHPHLSKLPPESQLRELVDSKRYLEEVTGFPIRYLAYPAGDYCRETLNLVRQVGYEAAFATIPLQLGTDPLLEVARVGIYSASLLKLKLKVLGLGSLLRRIGIRIG